MVSRFTVALLPLLIGTTATAQLQVANHGKATCSIIVDPNASPAERHAATELADYFGKITGVTIPLVFTTQPTSKNVIVVGHGTAAQTLFPEPNWKGLGQEQTLVRSKNHLLLVSGGDPRGTLFAAYRLLNRLGVQWWTPWATDIPKNQNLTIPKLDLSESPALEYRDPSFHSQYDNAWAAHALTNEGPSTPDLGGGVNYAGFVHTYYPLVDPKIYFPIHPEWFSLINGKRTTDNAQLCTTDPNLREFVLKQVKALLHSQPNATIVSVSQNDCFNPCQCDRCQALAKSEGSQSAPVLALANYVADGIKDEFPNVAVDTLAYQWSRHAPKNLKPRPNVIVRLCSIECDFAQPLDAPKNKSFAQDVLDWSRLTNRLYVWDYVTNFANYLMPMPDELVLGPNLKFLAAHGVKGVFEEGDYTSNGGSMSNLKAWMLSQLLWDPKADDKKLRTQFLNGYYGPAAGEAIGKYIDLVGAKAAATACTIFQGTDAPYLTADVLLESETLWHHAELQVLNDPEKLWRVRESHLAIQFMFLKRWDELKKANLAKNRPWLLPDERNVLAAQWLEFTQARGPAGWSAITAVNEGEETPEAFVKSLTKG